MRSSRLLPWIAVVVVGSAGCSSGDSVTAQTTTSAPCGPGGCEYACPDTPCPATHPNCDSATGLCAAACGSAADCPDPSLPNCDATTGLCFDVCLEPIDCSDPATPVCDPTTGLCQGACPTTPCPVVLLNCDPATGLCQGPCPDVPCPVDLLNCDPATGLCQGACPDVPCPTDRPYCDSATGLCEGGCPTTPCPEGLPNCDPSTGVCLPPCTSGDDCYETSPNCDPGSGLCGDPCADGSDCPDPTLPNCDPTPGVCLPPCAGDYDCPDELWKCDTATGLCLLPACTNDAGCAPPATVCEDWACVAGCQSHQQCAPADRCDLVDSTHLYHCEPRDCLTDGDCTTAGTVCDVDGLADPEGGGYCVPGCVTFYDCPQVGDDCDATSGICSAHDYGDIGVAVTDCAAECSSGFCIDVGGVTTCTEFCCIQHDCPADWGCRPLDDGTGSSHTVSVCEPLAPGQGTASYGAICAVASDCRSNVCSAGRCRESCCTHDDCDQPFVGDMYCGLGATAQPTVCLPEPTTGIDPLGTLGCGTSSTPSTCLSNLCFTLSLTDTGCTTSAECPVSRPTCWDAGYGDPTLQECVRDFCVDHCCSTSDCPAGPGGEAYFCGKWRYSVGDFDVCLARDETGSVAEGGACAADVACLSRFCQETAGVCRERCCTDADCTNPAYPRCALESHSVYGSLRMLNVCLPP